MTEMTLARFAQIVSGGVIYNDRGNGSAGPLYLGELSDLRDDETRVVLVSEDEDPEAWQLAREAFEAIDSCGVEYVAVGERTDAGHQAIYCG